MIHVECYSAKGLAVKGASAEQAEAIRAALGAAVVTAFDAKRGGWLFSRKREDRIRELVKAMQPTEANAEPVNCCQLIGFDGKICGCTGFHHHDHPARVYPKPCYCNQLAPRHGEPGLCDFCSGIAALDGVRAEQWRKEQDGMPGEWFERPGNGSPAA